MRFQIIKLIYMGFFCLILLRLFYWQVGQSDMLNARAESQRFLTTETVAPRGDILFSDGSTLATSQPAYSLFAQPKIIDQSLSSNPTQGENPPPAPDMQKIVDYKKQFALTLAQQFHDDDKKMATQEASMPASPDAEKLDIQQRQDWIFSLLNKDLFWVNLNKKVDNDEKRRLEGLNLTGLGFDSSTERFYPEGSSSAHLLGVIGSDPYGLDIGYNGVEGYYNGELKGRTGSTTQERDALGLPILIGQFTSKDPKPGKTLVLHIDRAIQKMMEDELQKGIAKFGAKNASAIIMDPQTGAIIAMASLPSFDPARAQLYPKENFRNLVTSDAYEPGSTFKVLVMAAAINEHLVTPDTTCDICAGPVKIDSYDIRTWNNQYEPNSTMRDVIIHSDNTGMVFVARKLGLDKMYDYIKKFGFGNVTGIDVQDEQSPDLRAYKDWKDIDVATSSFGQGILATELQLVRAVSVIANGGKLMEPHVVAEIHDGDKKDVIAPRVVGNPITEDTAKQVNQMMVDAVNQGEAKFFRVKGYKIAGKTGTAQIAVAGHYDASKTIASFVGFAPAENPRFVMLVRYDEPATSIYGAETAAPSFFNITKELFTYYGIPPSDPGEK